MVELAHQVVIGMLPNRVDDGLPFKFKPLSAITSADLESIGYTDLDLSQDDSLQFLFS
jgi:hypothetical protein